MPMFLPSFERLGPMLNGFNHQDLCSDSSHRNLTPLTERIDWLDQKCYMDKDHQNIKIVDGSVLL